MKLGLLCFFRTSNPVPVLGLLWMSLSVPSVFLHSTLILIFSPLLISFINTDVR